MFSPLNLCAVCVEAESPAPKSKCLSSASHTIEKRPFKSAAGPFPECVAETPRRVRGLRVKAPFIQQCFPHCLARAAVVSEFCAQHHQPALLKEAPAVGDLTAGVLSRRSSHGHEGEPRLAKVNARTPRPQLSPA